MFCRRIQGGPIIIIIISTSLVAFYLLTTLPRSKRDAHREAFPNEMPGYGRTWARRAKNEKSRAQETTVLDYYLYVLKER